MCQKAVANLFATIGVASKSELIMESGEPGWFRSSAQVERGFCRDCGTPLFYSDKQSADVGIMIGSTDNPSALPPERQDSIERRPEWLLELRLLPEKAGPSSAEECAWAEAIRHSNRQHPDGSL